MTLIKKNTFAYINKCTCKSNKLTVKCFSFRNFLNILRIIFEENRRMFFVYQNLHLKYVLL